MPNGVLDIAKTLGEDIIFGRLRPGARLIEDHLIGRFGASRHYIRQSLDKLERIGIVVREKNKGVAVRSLTPREVHQIYEVRELLQRQAILRIRLPAAPHLIQHLEKLHEEYREYLVALDFGSVHEINDAFHLTLFSACENQYLVESIKHYMSLSLLIRSKKTTDVEYAKASERDHYLMIQLMKGTDNWALAQICVEHIQAAKDAYTRELETWSLPKIPR